MKLHGTMSINEAGHLVIGGCDTVDLAREYGTPLYVMDEDLIRQTCRAFRTALAASIPGGEVVYASKAFTCQAMMRIAAQEGLAVDVVSGGELYTALTAGVDPARLFFHGNNKTPEELRYALESRVGRIVVDSDAELQLLDALAGGMGLCPQVLLRVQPGVEPHTHSHIQTGQTGSKFGLNIATGQAMDAIRAMHAKTHMDLVGIHCHIGSQITEEAPYVQTAKVMAAFLAEAGRAIGAPLPELNLGGGFGIYYNEKDEPLAPVEYVRAICSALADELEKQGLPMPGRVCIEPGRAIVGNAGTTLYTVGSIKAMPGQCTYVAVDGGMADNPRPSLYQAEYEMCLANKMTAPETMVATVAGKCCESGDILIRDAAMPQAQAGDILAVSCTGAYNYAMASNYNRIPKPAVVLVADGESHLIVKRETYEDVTRNDLIPAHLR